MRDTSRSLPVPGLVLAVVVALLTAGCTQVVPGRASAIGAQTTAAVAAPNVVPLPGDTDGIASAAVAALQEHWRAEFPAVFGREWRDVDGFVPIDPGDPSGPEAPCVDGRADVADQAYYCPAADVVVWDAAGLLPGLHERFGPPGVVIVLAHEVGHAVQNRLGIDEAQARDPGRYPTILLEAMADCYAGSALATIGPYLGLGVEERDAALLALVGFRDPLGVVADDASAHGNAFDRVSAFQDGFDDGAARCADMSLDNRTFTQRRFGSAADEARGGDLPLSRLLEAVGSDARGWFTAVGAARVPGWQAPPLSTTSACGDRDLDGQGPARFCATDGAVSVDRAGLAPLHRDLGDFAGATLVASRYGLAVLRATGAPTEGAAAGTAAVCLAGAYTGRLFDSTGTFTLSPGDLDEAIQVLLEDDWATRDSAGAVAAGQHGFDRVARFRAGLLGGPDDCLPPV